MCMMKNADYKLKIKMTPDDKDALSSSLHYINT